MNKVRERKLEARARRLESFRNQYGMNTAEKTIIQVPQPKALVKNDPVKVDKNKPVLTEPVKRGRGRPPKAVSEKINKTKALAGKKTAKGKGKK